MDCHDLDDESHRLLQVIQGAGFRRKPARGTNVHMARISADNAAAKAGLARVDARDLLVDLHRNGWVVFIEENSSIGRGERSCSCGGDALASAVGRARTSLGAQGEEGGKWEDFQGPEVPSAHVVRETESGQELPKTASQTRREKREARLDRVLKKRKSELNSNDLAMIFSHRLYQTDVFSWSGVGATNHKALASNIATWIREGGSPELIREMIEVFVGDRHLIKAADLPWRAFINSRAILAQRAERSLGVPGGDLGWVESETFLHADVDLGWGSSEEATTDSRHEDG